jgi:hypothetical protein
MHAAALAQSASEMLQHHRCCNRSAVTKSRRALHPLGSWRDLLGPIVRTQLSSGALVEGGHVYEFGVGAGSSIRTLDTIMQCAKSRLQCPSLQDMAPRWSSTPFTWFAFDSFDGLPANDGLPSQNASSSPTIAAWQPGAYAFDPRPALHQQFGAALRPTAGFFSESLRDSVALQLGMRPAMYVDIVRRRSQPLRSQPAKAGTSAAASAAANARCASLAAQDVDLYGSTVLALDFLLRNSLVVPGTLIGRASPSRP